MNRPKFYPQHKEKCYCIKGCVCGMDKVPEKTHSRFVKISTESGRPPKWSSTNLRTFSINSGPSSRRTSSINSTVTSNSNFEKCTNSSSELTLTNRRLNYEQKKHDNQTISAYNDRSDVPSAIDDYDCQEFLSDMDFNRVSKLNEFRLQNVQDCFSILSNHSANQRRIGDYNKNPVGHTCEFVYQLDSREILTPSNIIEDRPICATCKQPTKTKDLQGVVPLQCSGGKPHKVILQIQDIKGHQPFHIMKSLRTQNGVANSLALRYQQLA